MYLCKLKCLVLWNKTAELALAIGEKMSQGKLIIVRVVTEKL